ncbi:MAG TPA: GlxA family transcriptional regulator [Conexibacter sp.]|jgi:transcriptional regulator GlxA family with amidase domain
MASTVAPPTVVVLAYDGVQLLDVTGPLEVFTTASEHGAAYAPVIASVDGGTLRTSGGTRLGADRSFDEMPSSIDTLIVPGAPGWEAAMARPELLDAVRDAAQRSRRVASVCAGAFVLAAAGLLDGRRATTHWRLVAELAERFPNVRVDPDAIHVVDGDVFSSAGVSAGIDLCLALVEADHGPALTRAVARQLVVFMQRPGGQAQFSARLRAPAQAPAPLRAVLDEIAADPAGDHRLEALSERAGFSSRHLARVFTRELGVTPARWVEQVRFEAARDLLEASDAPLASVATASGLGSAETLRRVFLRALGVTPNAYRQRFRSAIS